MSFAGEYDIRAFLKLYRETADEKIKELLFRAAVSCSYCINDKCTTFLMARNRTTEWNGRVKKLCAFFRHRLNIPVTGDTIAACVRIAEMMFEYTYPYMHADLFYENNVTYTTVSRDEFYIVGYMARHNALSKSDDELVKSVLADSSKLDALYTATGQTDNGRYVGATDKFANGNDYEFIFGVIADRKPETLPDQVVCRKIRGGEWAVYNSSAHDYKSIWRDFSANYYNNERKGYDTARIPFEFYSRDGSFFDVHIPVDGDMPADSAKTVTMQFFPQLRVAGFPTIGETDHPLHVDYGFDIEKRLTEAFPFADRLIGIYLHAFFGKPMRHGVFYAYDDLTPVPNDIPRTNLKAGWFLVEGRKHFNGGVSDYPFDRPINFRTKVDDMHHPGLWLDVRYPHARGGHIELANPAQIVGNRRFEVVELPSQRVIGKLEAPPESIVTDEEKEAFYTLPENSQKGTYMIGYTVCEPSKAGVYYDKPLVKGVLCDAGTPPPRGLSEYYLEAGKFVKITEDAPNGEPGWEIEWLPEKIKDETGCEADMSRQFIIKQTDFGRSYEFYIPCK
ncbi:MAG: hypothetical protein GX601_06380 [Anaerolineales bacterium]|nr:hypothetical protein [Anaerolineales bacterium]